MPDHMLRLYQVPCLNLWKLLLTKASSVLATSDFDLPPCFHSCLLVLEYLMAQTALTPLAEAPQTLVGLSIQGLALMYWVGPKLP